MKRLGIYVAVEELTAFLRSCSEVPPAIIFNYAADHDEILYVLAVADEPKADGGHTAAAGGLAVNSWMANRAWGEGESIEIWCDLRAMWIRAVVCEDSAADSQSVNLRSNSEKCTKRVREVRRHLEKHPSESPPVGGHASGKEIKEEELHDFDEPEEQVNETKFVEDHTIETAQINQAWVKGEPVLAWSKDLNKYSETAINENATADVWFVMVGTEIGESEKHVRSLRRYIDYGATNKEGCAGGHAALQDSITAKAVDTIVAAPSDYPEPKTNHKVGIDDDNDVSDCDRQDVSPSSSRKSFPEIYKEMGRQSSN